MNTVVMPEDMAEWFAERVHVYGQSLSGGYKSETFAQRDFRQLNVWEIVHLMQLEDMSDFVGFEAMFLDKSSLL